MRCRGCSRAPIPSRCWRHLVRRSPGWHRRRGAPRADRRPRKSGGRLTYLRSKTARMEDSDFSATAYDRVYDADRRRFSQVDRGESGGDRRRGGHSPRCEGSVPSPSWRWSSTSRRDCRLHDRQRHDSRDIEGEPPVSSAVEGLRRSCAPGSVDSPRRVGADARDWTVRSTIISGGKPALLG